MSRSLHVSQFSLSGSLLELITFQLEQYNWVEIVGCKDNLKVGVNYHPSEQTLEANSEVEKEIREEISATFPLTGVTCASVKQRI